MTESEDQEARRFGDKSQMEPHMASLARGLERLLEEQHPGTTWTVGMREDHDDQSV